MLIIKFVQVYLTIFNKLFKYYLDNSNEMYILIYDYFVSFSDNNTYVTLNVVNLVRSGSSRGRQGDQGVAPPSYYEAIQSPSSPCSPSSQQELLSSTDK